MPEMSPRQVFRTAVPVDDQWHTIEIGGPILHVDTRSEWHVELWFLDDPSAPPRDRTFRVFGTGQPLERDVGEHVGTAITPSAEFVRHVFEKAKP